MRKGIRTNWVGRELAKALRDCMQAKWTKFMLTKQKQALSVDRRCSLEVSSRRGIMQRTINHAMFNQNGTSISYTVHTLLGDPCGRVRGSGGLLAKQHLLYTTVDS